MKKVIVIFLLLLCSTQVLFSQNKIVKGVITDENQKPIDGASVLIKGSKVGVAADSKGQFSISAKPSDILLISAIGFESKQQKVGTASVINISLLGTANTIEDVVVTALGIKRQPKELGVSTARIKGDELTQAKIIDLSTGLSAKIAGLQVNLVNNGINPDVRIVSRGNHSLTGNNQVLLVVDGVPLSSQFLKSINPNDVDNMTLLKGPSASALYGIEAANGVMIITTKKGNKGQPVIKFTTTTQMESISYFPKIQDKYSPNGGEVGPGFFDPITGAPVRYDDPFTGKLLPVPFENQSFGSAYNSLDFPYSKIAIGGPVNGQLLYGPFVGDNKNRTSFFQTGVTTQNDISYSSGDQHGSFMVSIQDVNVKGIVPLDSRRRTGARFSASKEYGKFSASFNLGYTQSNISTYGNEFFQGRPLFYNIINQPAHLNLKDFRDVDNNPYAGVNGFINAYYPNPWWQIYHTRNTRRQDDVISSLQLGFQATNWLNFTYRVGYSQTNINSIGTTDAVKFNQEAISDLWTAGNIASALVEVPSSYENTKLVTSDLNTDFLVNISQNFFNKNITAKVTLGNNLRLRNNSVIGFNNANLAISGFNNINNRQGDPGLFDAKFQRHDVGVYGDIVLGYKDYLFVHSSYRRDGVSILDEGARNFGYYSLDGSFVLTDAFPDLKSNKLTFAKARIGYSQTGNTSLIANIQSGAIYPVVFSNLGAYATENVFGSGAGFPFGNLVGYTQGFGVVQKGLKPEKTKSFETGIQLGLNKNKINLEVVYFNDQTVDQTLPAQITTSTGANTVLINAGKLGVKGMEFDLKLTPLFDFGKVKWGIGANFSFTDNKVLELTPGITELQLAGTGVAGGVGAAANAGGVGGPGGGVYAIVGQDYPVIKTNDWLRDPSGRVIVNAITGLPSADPTLKVMGNTNHKYRLGLNTNITWKRFTFNAVADYRSGASIFNIIGPTLDFAGISANSAQTRERFVFPNSVILDAATGKYVDNTNVTVRDGNATFWSSVYRRVGYNYVNNASFWKLREVSISYDLPENFLGKSKFIKKASITLVGRNLLTLVPSTNVWSDPEFSVDNGNGVGRASILETPPTRIFGASLNITF